MLLTLTVIYTQRLEECRAFYEGLGLHLEAEQHGRGPAHYAAVLGGRTVFELYPAGTREPTGRLRLGFAMKAPGLRPGVQTLTDPDGRAVEVTVLEEALMSPDEVRILINRTFGDVERHDVRELPDGGISVTVDIGSHVLMIDGRDQTGWAWSVDPDASEAFTGHASKAASLAEALAEARSSLA